jgi:hypothetical protein
MVSAFKTCQHCGEKLSGASNWNRKYCNDKCRVAGNRAKKPTPKKSAAMKAEKYDRLLANMRDSIAFYEKRAAAAEIASKEATRPTGERLAAGNMVREYQSIANELKRLIDYTERMGALQSIDPIFWD